MERKLKLLRIMLIPLFALLLACGVLLCGAPLGVTASATDEAHTFIIGTADENTEEVTYEQNLADGWEQAVALSLQLYTERKPNLVKVVLASDWIAADLDGETSFGLGEAFSSGTLYVPQGANILLDLNGYIVNRNLTAATKSGGVFTVAGELTLTDSRPEAEQFSLVYETEEGSDFVRGGAVTGGNTTENGGAVLVLNWGHFTLSGGTLFQNAANVGGGVCVNVGGECTVDGGSVFYNSAKTLGGGVYADGRFTMNGGSVSGNTANYGGGVAAAGNFYLRGGEIKDNGAVTGGGVYMEESSWFEMTGGSVRNNRATETGGGVEVFGTLTMDGGSIFGNTAKQGGGIFFSGNKWSWLEGESTISGNTATDGAGVLMRGEVVLDMSGSVSISDNTAENRGGGIFLEQGILFFDGSVTGNSAAYGGGVEVADDEYNRFLLEGNPVIENNGEQNLHLCGEMFIDMGELGEEASVYLSVAENYAFTAGYAENNLTGGASYGKKPSLFFTSDNPEQKIILNDSGELVMVPVTGHPLTWTVAYADGSSEAHTDEYGVSFLYGEHVVTGVYCNGDGENYLDGEILQNAGEYMARSYTFGSGVSVRFTVSIQSRPLDSEGVLAQFVGEETPALVFTGKEQTPGVELLYNGKVMEEGRDYALRFENNLLAGTAYAVVYGEDGNNFKGEIKLPFNISPSTEIAYNVRWEYFGEDGWTETNELTFQARDMRGAVRAVLFAETADGEDITEYVYAEGFGGDAQPNLTLVWNGEGVDARDYTVTITGTPNGVLAANKKETTVTIHKATLPFTAADFSFEDENRNRLWVLDGGSQLRDQGTVYFDPDAAADEYGNTVTVGTLNDAYARFRGEDKFLELVLNGAYEIGGTPLSSLSAFMQVSYSGTDGKPTNRATGAENAVTEVQTKVTITFGDNYELGAGGNTVVLEKTWYIVVINNGLLGADGGAPDELSDMVYGNATISGFRPEHGKVIIYTVTAGTETLFRFAAVVNDSTQYYGVTETDGVLRVDYSSRIYSDSYLNQCLNRLSVGGYTLTTFVPQQEEDGATYYAFTQSFSFHVLPCSIERDGEFVEGLSYFLLSGEVTYNGKCNNTPKITVVYDRKTLREGVDFALSSTRVSVGAADLTVRGIGNYSGEVFLGNEVFQIVRATNDWVYTPSVTGWEFGGFEREVNRFQAAPALLDEGEAVWFGLFHDEACLSPVANLAAFNAVGGVVSNTVAERLRALPVGTYYVKTSVRETQNYTGLEPAANALKIERAANDWITFPTVIGWNYAGYDKNTNLILASVAYGGISFHVTDADGRALTEEFTLTESGLVSAAVADILSALPAGDYRLTASVSVGESYSVPAAYTYVFTVRQAVNGWEHTPSIVSWVQGKYSEEENPITAGARFGTVQFRITAADDLTRVLYDSAEGINLLNEAGAGLYMLSAYVADGDANYTDLSPYMVTFRIFAPAGMPWWGTLLIVVGVLLLIALVFFILQKKGVLQVLSGKMVIAIRAKAAADATIAAVRANKKAEEEKASLARAEKENADISDGKEV